MNEIEIPKTEIIGIEKLKVDGDNPNSMNLNGLIKKN